jgi:zinc protease
MPLTLAQTKPLNAPTVSKLPNGLTIIAEQMPVEAVNLNLWLPVGSLVETDDINGMAHFLEHMVFKGTQQLAMGEFERRIEEMGAVTNAATSQDYTHYYITTAPKDFAALAPLQLEVVLNASIPEAAFHREKSVVIEEINRSDDSPQRRVYQQAIALACAELPYRRPVLGPRSVIEGLAPEQMQEFHRNWYRPASMTVAVVGNLPETEMIQIITDAIEETGHGNSSPPSCSSQPQLGTYTPEVPFQTIVRQEYTDAGIQQARLVMVWRVPGFQDLSSTYAFDVLSVILGQGKLSRLFQELREEKQLVTQIGVSNMTFQWQGVFYISAQLPAENIPVVEAAIVHHLEKLQQELITPTEIDRVRTQVANRFIFGNERPSDRAGLYGYYHALLGDLHPAINYPQLIQSLTAADLQQAAQKHLNPQAYGVLAVKPAP